MAATSQSIIDVKMRSLQARDLAYSHRSIVYLRQHNSRKGVALTRYHLNNAACQAGQVNHQHTFIDTKARV